MKLNQELFKLTVDRLQHHMDAGKRQALIIPIFSEHDILFAQIDWEGDNRTFTVKLVKQLADYGRLESGEESLVLLLKTLGDQVGQDKKQKIEELLLRLDSMQSTGESQRNKTVKISFSRKSDRSQWGCNIFIMMTSMITVMLMLLISRNYTLQMKNPNPLSWDVVTHTPMPAAETRVITSVPTILPSKTFTPTIPQLPALVTSEAVIPSTPTSFSTLRPTSTLIPTVPLVTQLTDTSMSTGIPILNPTWTPNPTRAISITPTAATSIVTSTPQETSTQLPTETPIPSSISANRVMPTTTRTVTSIDTPILDSLILTASTAITFPIEVVSTTSLPSIDSTYPIEIREQSNVIERPQEPELREQSNIIERLQEPE